MLLDIDLARRLEAHEAWSAVAQATTTARLYPEVGAAVLEQGGAYAVYVGARSPMTRVLNSGMSGSITPADLAAIEAFYAERDHEVRIRVCPLAGRPLIETLAAAGYTLDSFMDVYARSILPDELPHEASNLRVSAATPAEARRWFEREGAGGDWAEPDGVTFMVMRSVLKPETQLYLAWDGDEPVAGGALEIHAGVAALMSASTLPAYRRRGLHEALVRARLSAAARAGCDVAMVTTRPGAASARNVRRAGFELQYATVEVTRPAPRRPDDATLPQENAQ